MRRISEPQQNALRFTTPTPTSSSSSSSLESSLILTDELRENLEHLHRCFQSCRSSSSLSLPIILVRGCRGSGRSVTSAFIARSSGLPYCLLNYKELGGRGTAAPRMLRTALERAARMRGLLVLDDADDLIALKGGASSSNGNLADALYVLLQGVGESCRNQCAIVLVSGSSPFSSVAPALLDRVDLQLLLPLPTPDMRWEFARQKSLSLLSSFLTPEEKAILLSSSLRDTPHSSPCSEDEMEILLRKVEAEEDDRQGITPQCLFVFVVVSEGWTFREMEQVLHSVQSATLNTELCRVTTTIWYRTVLCKVNSRKLCK